MHQYHHKQRLMAGNKWHHQRLAWRNGIMAAQRNHHVQRNNGNNGMAK